MQVWRRWDSLGGFGVGSLAILGRSWGLCRALGGVLEGGLAKLGGLLGLFQTKSISHSTIAKHVKKTDGTTTVLRDPALHLEVVGVLWERFLGGSGRSLEATWEVLGPFRAFFLPSRGSCVPCLRS